MVLWDHGGATYSSMSDDTDNGHLSIGELEAALAASPVDFDVLGFDACLMATVEVMHSVGQYVDYFVASEETEGFDGWDYTDLFNDILASGVSSPSQFAAAIPESSQDDASIDTLSATHAALPNLATRVGEFVDTVLTSATSTDWNAIIDARNAAPGFYYSEFRDLGGFMSGIVTNLNAASPIHTAASGVLTALQQTVIYNYSSPAKGGTGLSVYLPAVGQSVYNGYSNLRFCLDTNWDGFVQARQPNGSTSTHIDARLGRGQ